jgi:hypothetical protein
VGLDATGRAMTNTSIWDTRDHAMQMASLQAMLDLRARFEASVSTAGQVPAGV